MYCFQYISNLVHQILTRLWGNVLGMKIMTTDEFGHMSAHSCQGISIIKAQIRLYLVPKYTIFNISRIWFIRFWNVRPHVWKRAAACLKRAAACHKRAATCFNTLRTAACLKHSVCLKWNLQTRNTKHAAACLERREIADQKTWNMRPHIWNMRPHI